MGRRDFPSSLLLNGARLANAPTPATVKMRVVIDLSLAGSLVDRLGACWDINRRYEAGVSTAQGPSPVGMPPHGHRRLTWLGH
jgi:hypothetical protein